MIPKTIHYCWFGKKPLPGDVKRCIRTWRRYCPDYSITQWNEDNFHVDEHPFTRAAYREKAWAFVSDYARLKILYDNGGIYFDTDVELLKNIDELLEHECYLGLQQNGFRCNTGLGFGCEKHNKVIKAMLDMYDNTPFDINNIIPISCTYIGTKALETLGFEYRDHMQVIHGAVIYPSRYFDPVAPGNSKNLLSDETISIHHYTATWMPGRVRWRRKLLNLIGHEKLKAVKAFLKKG